MQVVVVYLSKQYRVACPVLFLVERDRKAQTIVAENIQMTKEIGKFQLLKMDAERALEQVSGEFDPHFLRPSLCQGTNQ